MSNNTVDVRDTLPVTVDPALFKGQVAVAGQPWAAGARTLQLAVGTYPVLVDRGFTSVNLTDFTFLAAHFNQSLPAEGLGQLVPEPAAASMLFFAVGLLRCQYRRYRWRSRRN